MEESALQQLRIEVLGPLRAWRGGNALDVGPVKRQAVLAALVLRQGTVVTHDQLLDGVWGAEPPASGHKVLPSHVNPLRRALDSEGTRHTESLIRSGKGWYRCLADGARLDVTELAERSEVARRARASGDLALATDRLADALALYRGEPLANVPGPFAQAERERLLERRRALRLARLDCLVLLGRFGEALDDLAGPAESDRYDESLLALRMRALYGCERQVEALGAFEDMRARLREELGVDPGEELARVHTALLRQDTASLIGPVAPPPAARPRPTVNQLPGDSGQLIGRESELALLTEPTASDGVAVVAVDGPAGVGKTALVVRAAHRVRSRFPDGCLFMDLQAHSTARQRLAPQRVLRRLLRSVGADDSDVPNDLDELAAMWRSVTSSLKLLLVLDDALGIQQIGPLLPAGPGSAVIVASRQRLSALDADRRVTLETLCADDAASLLRHIVGGRRADQEPGAIQELARLCAGLPLALRIAGTRLQTRPAWTLAYLVERMGDDETRLGELSAGDRSVEAAFRLSYDQLAPAQRRAFRAVGLAPTVEFDLRTPAAMLGWSPRSAERVMEELVDTSLVQQPRPGRYRLHDLVRVHARRLAEATPAEADAGRTAALRLYLDAARVASVWGSGGFPTGPAPTDAAFDGWQDATRWLDSAGGELVDVVGHAVAFGEADHACWIAEALTGHFLSRGRHHDCHTALETALPHANRATDRRMAPALRNALGLVLMHRARFAEAFACLRSALDLARAYADPHEEARTLIGLGTMVGLGTHALDGDRGTSPTAWLAEGLRLARGCDDPWLVAMGSFALGLVHHDQGRDALLPDLFRAAYDDGGPGRSRATGRALTSNLDLYLYLGRPGTAALLRRVSETMRRTEDLRLHTLALARLASAEHGTGNLVAAESAGRQALEQHGTLDRRDDPDHDRREMDLRCRLGRIVRAAGDVASAREQFRAALAVPCGDRYPLEYTQAVEGLRACR
ncbi:BTAD domain-containing putative transcriptional regulator [Streptomyces sp. NPDC057694]|uniref:AfsR/SARP family transcriptional regulator n=1 Tax=Streptomyces sp. NPDC057694 TaxID=3346216 RepID=UPI00368B03B9